MNCTILMGIKHCGKSTQGKILSKKLCQKFYDTDDLIQELTGKTPREIYTEKGAEGFMNAEAEACKNLAEKLSEKSENAVIATGGGICNNSVALEILHKLGTFIFLETPEETAAQRIVREIKYTEDGKMTCLPAYIAKKNPDTIEDVRKYFHEFYEERVQLYSNLSDITVKMTEGSKTFNADRILQAVLKNAD